MGFSDLTFIQSDRRLELLDALYQISQSAQFASYYPDMPDQDWEMCSSTCVEATLFRHALQAAFAFLDGTISDVREVMNMVDKDRRRQREWLAEKRIKRYGFSHDPVKADTTRHRRDPAGSSSDPCLARFHHTPSTIPSPLNKPTPSSTISSTASTSSSPSNKPTSNRAGTRATCSSTPLREPSDRAGTPDRVGVNARVKSTPLQDPRSQSPDCSSPSHPSTTVTRQPLGPQAASRWHILAPSAAPPDVVTPARHKIKRRRRRNRHRPHCSPRTVTPIATAALKPLSASTQVQRSLKILSKAVQRNGTSHPHQPILIFLPT